MNRLFATGAFAGLALVFAAQSGLAQSYPRNPYDYRPGNAGVMGIGPGGREAYHPNYYSSSPYARYGGYGHGLDYGNGGYGYTPWTYPPNITGLPSQPLASPDSAALESYRSRYSSATVSHPNAAAIDVKVPAQAQLWFQGQQTQQQGPIRFFESPPLDQGKTYAYKIKAVWTDDKGEKVERTRTVQVRSGGHVTLDFRKPQS